MKIVIIHGQAHEGTTCLTARKLAEKTLAKVGAATNDSDHIREFFLPRDFNEPCRGCMTCFNKDLSSCPHYEKLQPIADAMLAADLIILASPVYVYHATGQMMSLLDHFATWWMVHRPRKEMADKQAVVISTAAGGGMKNTCRDMADSLEMWGVRKVYRLGLGVQTADPKAIPVRIKAGIEKKTERLAAKLAAGHGARRKMNGRAKKWFYIVRLLHKMGPSDTPDYTYWEEKGWHGKGRPWHQK
ncbi:MAG: NAD(P)H-dependent oxidoreductase [Lachnospiraceae bacterium]|nr:NAD(P)H-dependent oxidoreductase [Lachnospiraceae bacterium]